MAGYLMKIQWVVEAVDYLRWGSQEFIRSCWLQLFSANGVKKKVEYYFLLNECFDDFIKLWDFSDKTCITPVL